MECNLLSWIYKKVKRGSASIATNRYPHSNLSYYNENDKFNFLGKKLKA